MEIKMKETQVYQTLVNQWTSQYNSLHELLDQEQRALENRAFEQLTKLVKQKNELVNEINIEQIPAIITQKGINQPTLLQVKQFCLQSNELEPLWNTLMALVDSCHHKNEVNSTLIELVTQSTKRTFNLIKGFDPDNNIYDANGDRKIVKHFSHSLSA